MKSKLSERDKKLLLILAILVVCAVPYMLLISPMFEKVEILKKDVNQLQTRKETLQQMDTAQGEYLSAAETYTVEKEKLLDRFPTELNQEESLLFITETERSIPISLYQLTFGENVAAQITSTAEAQAIDQVEEATGDVTDDEVIAETTQTEVLSSGLIGMSTSTQFSYEAGYQEFKNFLNFILNNDKRMVITDLTASYEADMNMVSGSFTLVQYALSGTDRVAEEVVEPEFSHGTDNVFMQAVGGMSNEGNAIESEPDFFLMLNQPDADMEAKIIGQSSDKTEQTFLVDDSNKKQAVTVRFAGENGVYHAFYSIDDFEYSEEGISFNKNGSIIFQILSNPRASDKDKNEVNLDIINETDVSVIVSTVYDDEANPRVVIRGQTGDIFFQ